MCAPFPGALPHTPALSHRSVALVTTLSEQTTSAVTDVPTASNETATVRTLQVVSPELPFSNIRHGC